MGSKLFQLFFCVLTLTSNVSQGQPEKLDERLGREGMVSVIADMGIYEDSVLTAYVSSVGQRVVEQLVDRKFEYQFFVVDQSTPNAFALPGGYIFVTRGLLALVDNTSELACILGHEIIHVHKRHSVKQIKKGIIPSILEVPGKLVGVFMSENLGAVVNAPISTGKALIMSNYSRKHEYESDQYGVQIAALAGYDPTTLAGVLHRIISWEETLTQQEEQQSYFSDHPYTPDRISNLNDITSQLKWEYDSINMPIALDYLDGLMFWDNPKKGIFNDHVFLHRDLNFRIAFPVGWDTANESTMVTANDSENGSFVHLSLDDSLLSAKKTGQKYAKYIKSQHYTIKVKGKKLDLNGLDAYQLSMEESANRSTVYINMTWIKMNGMMFKIAGVSTKNIGQQMNKMVQSLRPLSENEQQAVKRYSIKVVTANDESLHKFSARTDNLLSLELLRKMNGVEEGENLKTGSKIKIVVQE